MLALLEGHPRCPKFDTAKLAELRDYFEGVYQELAKFTSPANERVDSDILIYQVPGGMLSNFRTQLKEQGMSDKFDEVLEEIPVVREALGWIPLVTPTSQIVGTQAMMNVKFGRWKMICQPAQDIALGKYGLTPGPIDPGVLAQVEKQTGKKRVTDRPADLLEPGMEKYRQQCAEKGLPTDDETWSVRDVPAAGRRFASCSKPKRPGCLLPLPSGSPLRPLLLSAPGRAGGSGKFRPDFEWVGKRLFLTVNGQRHDVTVESLDS
jgi:pyruvate carboxylase subunit B